MYVKPRQGQSANGRVIAFIEHFTNQAHYYSH